MKNVGPGFAIAAIVFAGAAYAAPCAVTPTGEFARPSNLRYPDFCDIPPVPTDVRPAVSFRAAVEHTRLAGAAVVNLSGPETFSLAGTEAFAGEAKREAAPPPPMTQPGAGGTETFAAASKAKAKPPRRARRR
jgi:hypothetical protein